MYHICQSCLHTYVPYLPYILVWCESSVLKLLCRLSMKEEEEEEKLTKHKNTDQVNTIGWNKWNYILWFDDYCQFFKMVIVVVVVESNYLSFVIIRYKYMYRMYQSTPSDILVIWLCLYACELPVLKFLCCNICKSSEVEFTVRILFTKMNSATSTC